MKTFIKIGNETYIIIFTPMNGKESVYKPLFEGLWQELTTSQKQSLIILGNNSMKIINFNTLLNYFIYASGNEKIDVRDKCTCGEEIIYISYVTNKETNTETKIGCECIKWWDCEKEAINAIKILKARRYNKPDPIFCSFCKCQRKCINCKPKKKIRDIFDAWKTHSKTNITELYYNLNSVVKFGKYKGQKYYKLCYDEGYVAYLLNNNCNKDTYSILKLYRKYRLLLKKDIYKKIVN